MTFLASAYASWHRAHAAKDAGGSITTAARFIRMLAMGATKSRSTSFTRRRTVWGGGGQEDDVADHRLPLHHALPWQIWRVGFNAPPAAGLASWPVSTSGGGQGFFAL
jgi:hypothetical protein